MENNQNRGNYQSADQEDEMDLRVYIGLLLKWKWMIISITAVAIVFSAILSYFVIDPVYQTTTTLLVTQSSDDKNKSAATQDNLEGVVNTVSRMPEMTINTYVGQIKTDIILKKVTAKLNKKGYSLSGLSAMINVSSIKDSNLIQIDVTNTDPQLATDIANTLSDQVLEQISENNQVQMKKSVEFLQGQISNESTNMKKALRDLESFQSQPRSVDVLKLEMTAKVADYTKYQSMLQQLQLESQQAVAGKENLQSQLTHLPQDSNTQVVYEGQQTTASARIRESLSAKEVEISEKQAQVSGIVSILNSLQGDIKDLQKEVTQKQAKLDLLQADVDRYKNTNNLLQDKVTSTKIAKSINLGETSLLIASPAFKPTSPIKPNKKQNIAIAAILGLLLSIALAFILERLDNTFKRAEDMENILGLPVLGNIPLMKD